MVPPTEKLLEFFAKGTLRHHTKGDIILRTDQAPPGVFYVNQGYVKVYSITDNGDENLHIIYGPGSLFPVIWAITGRLRQVFYEAMNDVSLYGVDRKGFLDFIASDPEAADAVLHKVIDMFNVYADRVDNLEYTRSSSRIIYRLLKLAAKLGTAHGSGILFQAPIKHHDIANSCNCSRETVSREMEKLEKKGLIDYVDHHILVTNVKKLEEELHS